MLLVGQRYLEAPDGFDPWTDAALKRSHAPAERNPYDSLLELPEVDVAGFQEWLSGLSHRVHLPDSLGPVADFPWNAVYASAIDSVLANAFRNEWRDVQPVYGDRFRPANPRSPLRLCYTYLFGAPGPSEADESSPKTALELLRRRPHMNSLLRRVIEDVTPVGTLVIVGYDPARDWLKPDELAAVLATLAPGQAHLFPPRVCDLESPSLAELVRAGILTVHESTITPVLREAQDSGLVSINTSTGFSEADRSIFISRQATAVPKDIWNQVVRTAIPVSVAALQPPQAESRESRYDGFRRFLETADGLPKWESLQRGFAFRRPFSTQLVEILARRRRDRRLSEIPIIIHGPAGAGKSVAAATIALDIAAERDRPVLYIHSRTSAPSWRDLDQFVEWCEAQGAESSVVVWDGMQEPDDYVDLIRQLVSRGRQIVLVGTAYQREGIQSDSYVHAPGTFEVGERAQFADWLETVDPELTRLLPSATRDSEAGFWLPLLYRALPPSRSALRSSLIREVDMSEARVQSEVREAEVPAENALQAALIKAGLAQPPRTTIPELSLAGETLNAISALTNLVMVPGQFNLLPPVELLVRAIGMPYSAELARALRASTIIVWYEDQLGNVSIGPRNTVEAEIVVHSRLGTTAAEIEIVKRYCAVVRDDGDGPELRFLQQLIRAVGPQGAAGPRYRGHWPAVADSLRSLRTDRSIRSAHIMLHEANLRREWSQTLRPLDDGYEQGQEQLAEAVSVVREALDLLDGSERPLRRLRTTLYVELAAAEGALLNRSATDGQLTSDFANRLHSATEAIAFARKLEPANYPPMDVLFWITRDLIETGALDGPPKAEALASLANVFLTADPETFAPPHQEKFLERRVRLAEMLDAPDLKAQSLSALERMGSAAGHYLEALRLSGFLRRSDDNPSGENLGLALAYLDSHRAAVATDIRCLELELDIWWLASTGRRLMAGERITLPFGPDAWRHCSELIDSLEATGQSQRPAILVYLRGISQFHLGRYPQAFQTFDELERVSESTFGRKRIVRTYRASNPDGSPRRFNGTVSSISEDGRDGYVFVPELSRRLRFFPLDFGWPELRTGQDIGDFLVAFNLRGISADSARHLSTD